MDEQIKAADLRIANAKTALTSAQAELKTATEANDETKKSEAASKIESLQSELDTAEADRLTLDADDDQDDLLKDALNGDKLKDGTDKDKKIEVTKVKFDELNEQAKLFGQFAPILAKLQKDPALAKKLMEGDDPAQSLQDRLTALEDRDKADKRTEVTRVIQLAMKTFPDFKQHWESVKALLPGLEKAGVSYADSIERAYFAVNPKAASEGKRISARERENERGSMRSPGGGGPVHHRNQEDEGAYAMNEADEEFARATGVDPKLYAKHAEHIKKFADL